MAEDRPFHSFDIDIDAIVDVISGERYGKVVIQAPEGMKRGLLRLASDIEKRTGAEMWVDGEPCYGACDHAGERAKLLGADALIHLGHSDIPSMERRDSVPVHFFHAEMGSELNLVLEGLGKISSELGGGTVALFTTIQHLPLLEEAGRSLEKKNVAVHIGRPGSREKFPGQVLGCSFSAVRELPSEVEALVFIGTGSFHPMGLALASGMEVHTIDPMTGESGRISNSDLDRMMRIRFAHISRIKDLLADEKTLGVIVGSKPGQRRMILARDLLGSLKKKDLKASLVIMDHLEPMKLKTLGIDGAVSTACPRIAFDDSIRYSNEGITLITPIELRIALDEMTWSDYRFDEEW